MNLVTGLDVVSDRPLHLSVRFGGRVVVRNHFERNAWGSEERHGTFPFQHGSGFTITIVVEASYYRVSSRISVVLLVFLVTVIGYFSFLYFRLYIEM